MTEGAGLLFVVTAPSGAGKTSLCRELIEHVGALRYAVSHTTRPPRAQERDGVDYHFVDRTSFQDMAARGSFAESAEIHGNLYGSSVSEIDRAVSEGYDLLLEIEGQGARQIKRKFPESILIFITTPSMEELRTRLYARNSDSPEEIERRLEHARAEIAFMPEYDYIIINDDFDEALLRLMSVVVAARCRREAVKAKLPEEFRLK